MQIIIAIIDGETFTLEVNTSDTVLDVKKQIEERIGFPDHVQRLRIAGRLLDVSKKLSYYNVQNGTQLDLLLG
jgi:hypothetical protein